MGEISTSAGQLDGRHPDAQFLPDGDRNWVDIPARWSRAQEEKPLVSRLAIAFVLALAATAANARDTKSGQSQTPAAVSANGTRPFLFDGRMPGDGVRQGALADVHHPNAGAIVVPPKASQPGREQ
jgi:hypothetical protein